jgi:hypothetical protein
VINKIDAVLEHLAVENQHDMEAMLATLDSENPIRDEVAGKNYQGKDEVAGRYAELWIAFPNFNVRIVNVIDFTGDKILRETIYMDLSSQLRQLDLQHTV